jgi:uncharacterized protein (TIRG00374 family)
VESANKSFLSSKYFTIGLSLLISVLSFYLAVRNVDLSQVWQALTEARLSYIGIALITVGVNTLAKAIRWKVLVGPPGKDIKLLSYVMILLVGQTLNSLFPARAGDFSRAYVLGNRGPGKTYIFSTVVLEKILDALTYVFLFLFLLILIPLPSWMSQSIYVFSAITFFVSGVVVLLTYRTRQFINLLKWFIRLLPGGWQSWIMPRLRAGLLSLDVVRKYPDLIKLFLLTGISWGTAILNNQLVLKAFQIDLPWTASLLVLIGLQAGISIPSVPGRLGLFEYICVLALSLFDIDQTTALSYGFLLHGVVFILPTVLGLISFWLLGLRQKAGNFQDDMV